MEYEVMKLRAQNEIISNQLILDKAEQDSRMKELRKKEFAL